MKGKDNMVGIIFWIPLVYKETFQTTLLPLVNLGLSGAPLAALHISSVRFACQ